MADDDDIEQMVVDCEKRESRLSAWEHDFIVTCRDWVDAKRKLTPPMADKLTEVWEKATDKG